MTASKRQERELQSASIDTAKAFYMLFRTFPKKDKMAIAQYIFEDADIRRYYDLSEAPNETTLKSFSEDKSAMPLFNSIEELRKDLLN